MQALTAADALSRIRSGKLTAEAYVTAMLDRAERLKSLDALISVDRDGAIAQARFPPDVPFWEARLPGSHCYHSDVRSDAQRTIGMALACPPLWQECCAIHYKPFAKQFGDGGVGSDLPLVRRGYYFSCL